MEHTIGGGPSDTLLKEYETSIKLWRNALFRTLQGTSSPEKIDVYIDRTRVERTLAALGGLAINDAESYRQEFAKKKAEFYAETKNGILARAMRIHHVNTDEAEGLLDLLYEPQSTRKRRRRY
jgi:hypothetical protein